MKKFLILLLFIPLTSCQNVEVRKTYYDSGKLESTVNLIEDNIEPFKELISEDNYNRNNSPTKSFFIGYWIEIN
jgi:hypothetical protein